MSGKWFFFIVSEGEWLQFCWCRTYIYENILIKCLFYVYFCFSNYCMVAMENTFLRSLSPTGWPIWNISFPFLFLLSPTRLLPDFPMNNTTSVYIRKRNDLPFASTWVHPKCFGRSVLLICLVFCLVIFLSFGFVLCLLPNVARILGLSILDFPQWLYLTFI